MPRCRIEITATARGQLRRASAWWQENRPESPTLVGDELAEAVIALRNAPLVGAPHSQAGVHGVRKLLLPQTQYFLYYRVDAFKHVVRVVAVWHTARGKGPSLR